MKVKDLIASFRRDTDDLKAPYLWSNADIVAYLNEAEEEACIRKRLLFDNYSEDLTQIVVGPGATRYERDSRIFVVTGAFIQRDGDGRDPTHLVKVDKQWVTENRPYWRTDTSLPCYVVIDETSIWVPAKLMFNYTVYLEGYRLPLQCMSAADMEGQPEIAAQHHRFLVEWAKHRGYQKPDTETLNPQKAASAEKAFSDYFGQRLQAENINASETSYPRVRAVWR